jgi:phosphoadenosine phosphosulfate reductase
MNVETLNQQLQGKSPDAVIQTLIDQSNGQAIVSTNFRPHEAVLLHMVTRIQPDIPVLWVDTSYNTPETYLFAERVIDQLNLNIHLYLPRRSRAHRDAVNGGIPSIDDEKSHRAFTEEVKLEPFARGLTELQPTVWFTALRKSQTALRAGLDIVSPHGPTVLKVAPLLDFTDQDMEDYLEAKGLPDEKTYFDPTKVEEKRECGLHLGPTP